jgi:hypothetical protein
MVNKLGSLVEGQPLPDQCGGGNGGRWDRENGPCGLPREHKNRRLGSGKWIADIVMRRRADAWGDALMFRREELCR